MALVDNLTLCVPRPSSSQTPHNAVLFRTPKHNIRELPLNHVLISVDRFGFSANNITYQALGETPHFRYFDYHPAPSAGHVSAKTHGLIPVWGFGTVVASTHPRIQSGERIYGYLAPTRYLLLPVSPSDVNKFAFYVPRPHFPADRRPYNQILRCSTDPQYTPTPIAEDLTMLYRPLFWTAFWAEDWLNSSSYRSNSKRILISSASSKTAFCLAYVIKKREVPGLYDDVAVYDEIGNVNVGKDRWIYVDVAGNEDVNQKVVSHFGSGGHLVANIALGFTNLSPSLPSSTTPEWSINTKLQDTPSPSSAASAQEVFFMVEWLDIRKHQISAKAIFEMQNQAWRELLEDGKEWVKLERVYGPENVKKVYEDVVKGGLGPDKGFIFSLWDSEVDVDVGKAQNASAKL